MEIQRNSSMRRTYLAIDGFEDGGRSHEPRNVGILYKPEKAKKQILPEASEGMQPCGHLNFSS